MGQTPEDRIRAHYRSLKKSWDYRNGSQGSIWMYLARQWKRPIRQIKLIVRGPSTWQSNMELPTQRRSEHGLGQNRNRPAN